MPIISFQSKKLKPKVLTNKNFMSIISEQEHEGHYSPWLILLYSNDNLESKILQDLFEIAGAQLFPKVKC